MMYTVIQFRRDDHTWGHAVARQAHMIRKQDRHENGQIGIDMNEVLNTMKPNILQSHAEFTLTTLSWCCKNLE